MGNKSSEEKWYRIRDQGPLTGVTVGCQKWPYFRKWNLRKQQKKVRKQNRKMSGKEHASQREGTCTDHGGLALSVFWNRKHACGWSEVSEEGMREDIRERAMMFNQIMWHFQGHCKDLGLESK